MNNQDLQSTQVFLVNVSEDPNVSNARKSNEIEATLQINLESKTPFSISF